MNASLLSILTLALVLSLTYSATCPTGSGLTGTYTNCASCTNSADSNNNPCTACNAGFVLSGTPAVCTSACAAQCLYCTVAGDSGKCTTASPAPSGAPASQSAATCAASTSTTPAATAGKITSGQAYYPCYTCIANCSNCLPPNGSYATGAPTQCISCISGNYLTGTATDSTTNTAYGTGCPACASNCTACTTATACSACATGYYLNSAAAAGTGSCPACPANCTGGCTSATACTNCAAGYYSNSAAAAGTGNCPACASNCTACTSATACTKCASGYYLNSAAAAGTGTCPACPTGCATCSSGTVCLTCATGYTLTTSGTTALCTFAAKLSMAFSVVVAVTAFILF